MTDHEAVCFRCSHVFFVAAPVDDMWLCAECTQHQAERDAEDALAAFHGGGGGLSERERWDYARDTGRGR